MGRRALDYTDIYKKRDTSSPEMQNKYKQSETLTKNLNTAIN